MTDEQFVRNHLKRLQAIHKTLNKMTTITYNDMYFTTLKIEKRIRFLKDELGIRIRKTNKKVYPLNRLFKITKKDLHFISIDE